MILLLPPMTLLPLLIKTLALLAVTPLLFTKRLWSSLFNTKFSRTEIICLLICNMTRRLVGPSTLRSGCRIIRIVPLVFQLVLNRR